MENQETVCSLCHRVHSNGHSKSKFYCSAKGNRTEIYKIRDYLSGYVGGCDVAIYATDSEIIQLCKLQDEIADLSNSITSKETMKKNMTQCIEKRK